MGFKGMLAIILGVSLSQSYSTYIPQRRGRWGSGSNGNVVIGNRNKLNGNSNKIFSDFGNIQGSGNFHIGANSNIFGNDNWVVGNGQNVWGSGHRMFGPAANPQYWAGY